MRVHESEVHLRHDDVRVVARVADDGRPFGVSQQVAAAWRREQFGRIVAPEQKRMPDRTIAVESLEIQPRRPRVPQLREIRMHLRRRSIGGDVVGDELAEKRPAGRLRRERRRFVCLVSAVAQAAGAAERKQQFLLGAERGEIRKEAPVHRRTDRRIDRPLCARRRETLDVVHVQILARGPWRTTSQSRLSCLTHQGRPCRGGRPIGAGSHHHDGILVLTFARAPAIQPCPGSGLAERRVAGRNERALAELLRPRVRARAGRTTTSRGAVARAEALADQVVESGTADRPSSTRAIQRRARGDRADRLGDVISRHRLNQHRGSRTVVPSVASSAMRLMNSKNCVA